MDTFNLKVTAENINGIEPLGDKSMYVDIDVKKFDTDIVLDALLTVMDKQDIIDYVESTK